MRRLVARCAALCGALLAATVFAQPPAAVLPQPRIAVVFPVGAQAGTAVEVAVTGTDIDEPSALLFSNPDIKAELVVPPEPKPDPKQKDQPKKQPKAGPVTSAKFKVTVPAAVPPGTYDVRVVGKYGVSNPRAFVVGTLPEVEETAKPHNDVPDAQKVPLNGTVNGTIAGSADADYYSFAGKAGQRVLASCATSSIDSKAHPFLQLFDAAGRQLAANNNHRDNDAFADVTLPADGDYLVRVSQFAPVGQAGGPEHFYRLTVTTGPWIDAVFPPAVQPGKPAQVTLYGRNLPGGKVVPGMTFNGRPVEALTVTVTPPAERGKLAVRGPVPPAQALLDGFEFRLPGSNPVPVYLTDVPVAAEKPTDNDRPETAEAIAVPGELAGRIEKRGDKDWYAFTAKKGEVFHVELFADRIGSGMDAYFSVRGGTDKFPDISGEQDDDPDVLHPQSFFNRSGDPPAYKFTAPADGRYLILVASREANANFGPRCVYRLRVAKPAPDFRAVVMAKERALPAAPLAGQGGDVALDVFVQRMDGFAGPVVATAEGLPPGVTAKPALIGTNQKWGTLVLSTADTAAPFSGRIAVKCTAQIDGKPRAHEARPATITWGVQPMQNIPTVARLDAQLVLAVRPEKAFFKLAVDLPNAKVKTKDKEGKDAEVKLESPLFVRPGDKITLPVKAAWQAAEARAQPLNVTIEATQPNTQSAPLGTAQGGNNQPAMTMAKDKNDGVLTVDVRPQAAPGMYQLVLAGNTQVQVARDPSKKDQKTNAVVTAYAAPLEVTVLPNTLGKFTVVPPPNNQLKAGTTAELTVKVERTADFAGEFKVQLVLPKDTKGLAVKEVTLPAGADEVKVPVEVAKDVKAGGLGNVSVTAVGTVHGKFPITHEVKVNGLQLVALPAEPKKK
jgi:hypothetical protein